MKKGLAIVFLSGLIWAREVVDLGKLKVEGAARGPEIQFIQPPKPDSETLGKWFNVQMEELEKVLLKPKLPEQAMGRRSVHGGRHGE